jgi:hypothetical protein
LAVLVSILQKAQSGPPTWIGNADFDAAATELSAVQVKSSLQPVERVELDIAKAFWPAIDLVLDNSHIGNLTALEKLFYLLALCVERKISQMRSVWRLCGKGKRVAIGHALCNVLAFFITGCLHRTKRPLSKASGAGSSAISITATGICQS